MDAGGFPYSSGIGVYRANGGWQSSYIFSAINVVDSFTWVSSTKLQVYGNENATYYLWQVDGPIYSFDHNSDHINVGNYTAYWNTYSGAFDGGYWSAQ